jgi:hypothetical protein
MKPRGSEKLCLADDFLFILLPVAVRLYFTREIARECRVNKGKEETEALLDNW